MGVAHMKGVVTESLNEVLESHLYLRNKVLKLLINSII